MGMIEFEDMGKNKIMHIAKEAAVNLTLPESQSMFRRLVENGVFGIFMADVKGYIYYVNHAFVDILGYQNKNDILGGNMADILFVEIEEREQFLEKINQIGMIKDYEMKFVRKDGSDVILSVSSNFYKDDDGKVIGLEGILRDVTVKKQSREVLLTEKVKLEQILGFSEVISTIKEFDELVDCVVDRVSSVLEAQKCSMMMVDSEKKTLMVAAAKGLSDEIVKEAKMGLGEPIAGVVAGSGQPLLVKNIGYDHKFQRANKSTYFGRSFMVVPVKLNEKVVGVINVSDKFPKESLKKKSKLNYEEVFDEIDLRILSSMAREVSIALENVELLKELNSLAVTDPLVNIYNYRQFSKSLDYELKRCRRSKISISIIMIDVDDFKSYNDTFGHLEGDALLKNLGQIFKTQLREVDIICRYAGDEFAIILPDTGIEGVQRAAQKIKVAIAQFAFQREVTLSYGIACSLGNTSQHDLIHNADKALYRAKQAGKNCIRVFQ